jgi:phosphate:Na+ symporter
VKSLDEGVVVNWMLDYDRVEEAKGKSFIIRYATSIDAKRIEEGLESEWSYSEPVPATAPQIKLSNLKGNEKYVVYIGEPLSGLVPVVENPSTVKWSSKMKAKTSRGWGVSKFLILIGALGLFIFGMKTMSDGMQRAAGKKLREMLGSITSNRVKGVITGFFTTAIVQSSSVTTVMTVSLVNAGLLTLRQSAGVMMGANIGTTITAWLIMYLGFKVDISSYALILIAFGAPLLFMRFSKSKEISNAVIGFAILFLGLQFLKDSVPDLKADSAIVQFFVDYKDSGFLGNVMFVALGALVTIVIQSSSAAMALTLTLVSKGIIPFEVACAMVLGENIGTTVTAEFASTIGNVHAKRSARIHSMFNVVGVGWMLLIFPIFMKLIGWVVGFMEGTDFDPSDNELANTGIAAFHTLFNLTNVLIMIWFVPQLVSIAERTVKSKGDSDDEFSLDFIGAGVVSVPSVGLMNAKKEIAKFGEITSRMSRFARVLLNDPTKKDSSKMITKIEKYEEITDRVEVEVADYLERISQGEMTSENSTEVRSMLSITNDLERIGDIFFQMSKTFERKAESKIYFDPKQRKKLNSMFDLLDNCFDIMNKNLNSEYGNIDIDAAVEIEKELNKFRDDLNESYLRKIERSDVNLKGGIVYKDIFSQIEKVGDHIINVSEAVAGRV